MKRNASRGPPPRAVVRPPIHATVHDQWGHERQVTLALSLFLFLVTFALTLQNTVGEGQLAWLYASDTPYQALLLGLGREAWISEPLFVTIVGLLGRLGLWHLLVPCIVGLGFGFLVVLLAHASLERLTAGERLTGMLVIILAGIPAGPLFGTGATLAMLVSLASLLASPTRLIFWAFISGFVSGFPSCIAFAAGLSWFSRGVRQGPIALFAVAVGRLACWSAFGMPVHEIGEIWPMVLIPFVFGAWAVARTRSHESLCATGALILWLPWAGDSIDTWLCPCVVLVWVWCRGAAESKPLSYAVAVGFGALAATHWSSELHRVNNHAREQLIPIFEILAEPDREPISVIPDGISRIHFPQTARRAGEAETTVCLRPCGVAKQAGNIWVDGSHALRRMLGSRTSPVSTSRIIGDWGPRQFMGTDGRAHGGQLNDVNERVVVDAQWEPGEYRIVVWASATDVDSEDARLSVRIGKVSMGELAFPPGPGTRRELGVRVDATGSVPLTFRFVNDARSETGDRNLRVQRVQVLQESHREDTQLGRVPVVLISIDTLRADHLSAYGYPRDTSPNLDALARAGVRYEEVIAASHWTAPSHATLLTGLHPEEHGLNAFPDPGALHSSIPTLASRLATEGYRTGGFTAEGYVSRAFGLDRGFQTWEQKYEPAARTFEKAADWAMAQKQPFFLFVHTYEVHSPYDSSAFRSQFTMGEVDEVLLEPITETHHRGFRPTPAQIVQQIGLYDAGIRSVDAALPVLLDALPEDTLVIVTSDHGEELFDHGMVGHSRMYRETLRIPLILHHPHLLPGVVSGIVPQVDIAPTILTLLDVPFSDLSGQTTTPALMGEGLRRTALSSSEMGRSRLSLIQGDLHWLEDLETEALFDIRNDPAEQYDLAGSQDTRPFSREARRHHERRTLRAVPEQSGQAREALETLGYLQPDNFEVH